MPAPFDGGFKALAEEYPELLLRLFGIIAQGEKPETIDVLRELRIDPVEIDHAYLIRDGDASSRVAHFEAVTKWDSRRIPTLAMYHFLLRHKFKLRVDSYLVMMAEKYAPRSMPVDSQGRLHYVEENTGFEVMAPYRVIRLWEIDPAPAFSPGCEPLLEWVPLLRGGEAEFRMALEAISALATVAQPLSGTQEPEAAARLMLTRIASLANLRYDKDTVRRLLDGLRNQLMKSELFVDTWLYQDGLAEGDSRGDRRGNLRGKRSTVRLTINFRFPRLEIPSGFDQIQDEAALDDLQTEIVLAENENAARTALQRHIAAGSDPVS